MARVRALNLFSRKRGQYTSDLAESTTQGRGQYNLGHTIMKPSRVTNPKTVFYAALGSLLAACATTPEGTADVPPVDPPISDPATELPQTEPDPAPTPIPEPAPVLPAFTGSGNAMMDLWRDDFASRAIASGRDVDVVYATLAGISPLDLYLGETVDKMGTGIADQAEFSKPIWDYVASAVSAGRKTGGAQKLLELNDTFDQIELTFGVNREAVTAIWAMETNLGGFIGNHDAANTLANMAVEGRRRTFAESELLALMKIQESGEVRREQLTSGWAGAMGQTQFMPSTFLTYAVDFDGDGNKDLWSNPVDALASAANYMAASGYQFDQPWGLEVRAPEDFEWSLADGQDRRMSTWTSMGLTAMSGQGFAVSENDYAELWLPAGASGPKYLLFKNFDIYKTYNRSDAYALAVGLLTDGVAGVDGPQTAWPTHLELLSKRDIMVLQDNLNRLGFDAGVIDGVAGRGTRGALREFQKAYGHVADGFPTMQALEQVISAAG